MKWSWRRTVALVLLFFVVFALLATPVRVAAQAVDVGVAPDGTYGDDAPPDAKRTHLSEAEIAAMHEEIRRLQRELEAAGGPAPTTPGRQPPPHLPDPAALRRLRQAADVQAGAEAAAAESAALNPLEPRAYDGLPPPEAPADHAALHDVLRAAQAAGSAGAACDTPLGTEVGRSFGGLVVGYSNCNEHTTSDEDHVWSGFVGRPGDPVPTPIPDGTPHPGVALRRNRNELVKAVTGMKYQCVEFARRALLVLFGVVFGDVMGAVDIWRLTSVHRLAPTAAGTGRQGGANVGSDSADAGAAGERLHFARYHNLHDADRWPEPGAVVIWPIQPDMPFGHVAIVTEVHRAGLEHTNDPRAAADDEGTDPAAPPHANKTLLAKNRLVPPPGHTEPGPFRVATVRIAEQNFHSRVWDKGTYTRVMDLVTYDGTYFALLDRQGYRCLGWMAVEPGIRPLQQLVHHDDLAGGHGGGHDGTAADAGIPKPPKAQLEKAQRALERETPPEGLNAAASESLLDSAHHDAHAAMPRGAVAFDANLGTPHPDLPNPASERDDSADDAPPAEL